MIARSRLHTVPLRVKLVAAVLVLVAAALLVISVSTTFFLRSYLVGQIDADVRSYVGGLKTVSSVPRPSGESVRVGLPTDFLVVVADESGYVNPNRDVLYDSDRISFDDLPEWPTDAAGFEEHRDELRTMKARDGNPRWRMYYARLANGQYIAVGQSLSDADLAVQRLIWIDVLVGGAVLIVLASLGAAIVRTSLKPLDEIEQTAAAIAAGDLSRRVPDPERGQVEPQTELGRLSRALNTMLAQIESAFYARETSEWAARAAEAAARDALVSAQTSETRARRSEERMRQFVADASHELRTPLTTIRGFAELHRQGAAVGPEDTARLLRRIEDEAARMGLLVEDLLLLARLDRERPLVLAPVELRVLATETVQAARAVAPERDIRLEVASDAGELVVLADDARLRQVLGNLMTNAITHTPGDASVRLRLRAESGSAVVEVADTGPGLTAEQAERVFERFYRADAARTRRAGGATGTGLGLAIVAALVAAHHGQVEVDSSPGEGATFRVRLPLAPESAEPIEES
ncbi:sensor histidine kinase [Polymorphospora rubra]|uniref:sensor histidine kinase n=1 Tax=Polymorphospora rubra TaxID=338584 RepID=UPI003F4CC103